MASITRAYFVAELTQNELEIQKFDHISLVILRGDGGRIWYESSGPKKSIGHVKIIIPRGPYDSNQILDALIAFGPKYFQDCKSLEIVKKKLKNVKRLDFDLHLDEIPTEWESLREEAQKVLMNPKITLIEYDIFLKTTKMINFHDSDLLADKDI